MVLPRFLTGDMVRIAPTHGQFTVPGMVISVQKSKQVPDAALRGMATDMYGWWYYVMTTSPTRFVGPLGVEELTCLN